MTQEAGSLVMPAADLGEKQLKDESDVAVGMPVDTSNGRILEADDVEIEEAEIKFAAELMKQ